MSRFLVNTYPCRECGEPVQVRRTKDIPMAICPPCLRRRQILLSANRQDEKASREFLAVNRKTSDPAELVIGCLQAAQAASRAAEEWLRALELVKPHEIRRLAKAARNRTGWAADLLRQLDRHLLEVIEERSDRAPVRGMIKGGGEAPSPAPGAKLRLVPRELEEAPEAPKEDG